MVPAVDVGEEGIEISSEGCKTSKAQGSTEYTERACCIQRPLWVLFVSDLLTCVILWFCSV